MVFNLITCATAIFLNTQWRKLAMFKVHEMSTISHSGKLTLEQVDEGRSYIDKCNGGMFITWVLAIWMGIAFIYKGLIVLWDFTTYLFSLAF